MSRYSQDHKEKTRREIVRAAAEAFRNQGISAVGVGEVMSRVGLTHGGFYAHFESKDALVAEALDGSLQRQAGSLAQLREEGREEALTGFIRWYLSRRHRDEPASGCSIPALGGDVTRQPPAVREAFARSVETYLTTLSEIMTDDEERIADETLVLAAGMAGAVLLSRLVDDPALSDRILRTARSFYLDTFAASSEEEPAITESNRRG